MPGFTLIIPEVPRPLHLVESVSGMLGDLLVGSTPDLDGGYKYQGAPIGYSCKMVAHKDGFGEIFSGNDDGPRGIYQVNCAGYGGCARCDRKLTRDMSHYYHSLPPILPLRSQVTLAEPVSPLRPRAHSLNAAAEAFTYPVGVLPKPTKLEIMKAELRERAVKAQEEIKAILADAAPKIPTGPRSMVTSRYNHETGQTFGPLSITNKAPKTRGRRAVPRRRLHEGPSSSPTSTPTIQSEAFFTPEVTGYDRRDTAIPRSEQDFPLLPGPMGPYDYTN